jgi:precorrin-4/cobalt-precorrin-4 C11-methyltransferase
MPETASPIDKVVFLGAGPGDPELVTLKGRRLLGEADTVIYAGSLVSREVLDWCSGAELIDSAGLDLEEIVDLMAARARAGKRVVRLHSGDPSLYGAINEQIGALAAGGIGAEIVPGVSSLSAAAAALGGELTVPGVSQTVIITRAAGRTPVPEGESLGGLAAHGATMAIFLSAGLADRVQEELLSHYPPDTPVAVIQYASRPGQKVLDTKLSTLAREIAAAGIDRTAIILVGGAVAGQGEASRLYARGFSHGYRDAAEGKGAPAERDEGAEV